MKISQILLSACLAFLFSALVSADWASAQTSVFINPSSQNVSLFSSPVTLTVNTSINNVNYLYGYQYNILYTQSILNITSSGITEGPFLKGGAVQTFCVPVNLSVLGIIKNIACTRQGLTNVSGSGNLTRLTFNLNMSIAPTTTKISIVNSKLSDINSQPITHTIANGTINIYRCFSGEQRVCGPSPVGECRSGTITCNTSNDWGPCVGAVYPTAELCNGKDEDCDNVPDYSENINRSCSLSFNGTCGVGTETCCAGQGGCPSRNWTGCPQPQTETCYDSVDQDCDGFDSTCKGDVANATGIVPDGCIDIFDLSSVAMDFGKTSGFNNPNTDIDKNGVVDIFDLVYIGKDFGVKRPGATC